MSALDLPVTKLTGIGKVKAEAFAKLSIHTIGDLLLHFPSRYENRGLITPLCDGAVLCAHRGNAAEDGARRRAHAAD